MTVLTIYISEFITAVEREYGDNVRYVESFVNWALFFNTVGPYMKDYAYIEVKFDKR